MKQFFYDMHGNSDRIRSKSIYASYLIIIITVMAMVHQFNKKMPIDYTVFFALLTTFTALCGMNLTAQMKAMEVKKNVAGDMVDNKEPGANEDAKEVLTADKP